MGATETVTRTQTVSPWRASLEVAWRRTGAVWTQFRKNRSAMIGLVILIFFTGMALLAPFIAPYGPLQRVTDVPSLPQPPSSAHLLGTNLERNDIYSQILWGSQVSLIVGLASAVVAAVLGTIVGLVSGYVGGWVDEVIM